ncbi:hypothetical protein GCK72_001621 [Caenorhabditis remanei]|uniref:Uncharacterized protein n=1 Tax=Caenorhabditis remanei TaxID=31234 RepID=A0A6A5HT57_CAERE|nr:hypothetical protein GCK72_001621 [Caenorhabditis remanei]KAF1769804.1 hypothetical protein GCK72_001621 [Caenorhabditis remanei]
MTLLSLPVAGDSHLRNITHINQIADDDRSLASLTTLSKSMRIQNINDLVSKFCRSVERTALKESEDSGGTSRQNDEGGNMPEEIPEEDIDNPDENNQEREGGQGNEGGDEGEGGNNEQVPGNGDEGSDSDSDNDLNYDGDNETEDSTSSEDEENDDEEEDDEEVVHQPAPQANIEQIERYIGVPHNNRNRPDRKAPYDLPDIVVNRRRNRNSSDTDSSTEARRKRKRRHSSAYDRNEQIKRRREDDDDDHRPPTPRPRFVPINF